ncbi:MAG: hypothetical protein K2X27_01685, partial [Candidatus Obscuribacterales bacterium]|nr:hypothetical protein [Candidatus Obscuribacterales bacterium]
MRTSASIETGASLVRPENGNSEQITMHKKMAGTETLGGKERYLTFLSSDKPIYKSGEKVYLRGVVLNAENHKPLPAQASAAAKIEIKGPKGDTVASGNARTQDGVWGYAWEVPEAQAGGEYTVKVSYPFEGHAPAERKFDIRAYRAPRLKSQIVFLRDGYAPGDKVTATLEVKRAEGGVPEAARVTVRAIVDGMQVEGNSSKVDDKGLCTVTFDLPTEIPRGEGTLSLLIEDGGVVESASKSIPILLQTVDLKIYPEGGELLGGFTNRVYIQAKQPNGKPADLVAKLIDRESGEILEFKTEHEGRGRFEFTPDAKKQYYLSISEPAGIKTQFPLPEVKKNGALIQSQSNVYEKGKAVNLLVGASATRFKVGISKREVELAECKVDLAKRTDIKAGNLVPISFEIPSTADGVLTVTVWGDDDLPLAERLIYREAANPLHVEIKADKKNYVPGDETELTVKTTDAAGKPVSAVVGVTVADDSVLEMIEKREQAPRLPVMLYLEPEVEDLADAHVYLDPKNPKAALATDLLLGTQGWRRFALMDLAKFVESNGDKARRAVAMKIQTEAEMASAAWGGVAEGFGAIPPAHMAKMAPRARGIQNWLPAPPLPAAVPMPMAAPMPAQAPVPAEPVANEELQAKLDGAIGKLQNNVVAKDADRLRQAIASSEKRKAEVFGLGDKFAGFAAGAPMADFRAMPVIVVREFAHQVRKDRKPTDRIDFAETLYWSAGVKTDAKTGEAKVKFGLSDSVSTFRAFADAYSEEGAIGAADIGVESVQPFYTEAKLPLEVSSGDEILLPLSLVNASSSALRAADIKVNLKGDSKISPMLKSKSDLEAGERVRWIQPIKIGIENGLKELTLNARAGAFEDQVNRTLLVKAKGFPIESSFGGIIEPGKSVVHTISIPKALVPASMLSCTAVYPTPLANMTEALQRLIQDPYGCFEQTSSTSYPLTMAQQYFLSHTGVDPKLVESSRQKLDRGYKMLVGFWCPDKGYEWFGENPGHEALTAFGLLHFSDMSQVREVDKNMVDSTRAWLLKQKDGKGGFSRKRRALHTWIEDKDSSNAYILWALLESGQSAADLKPELESLKT